MGHLLIPTKKTYVPYMSHICPIYDWEPAPSSPNQSWFPQDPPHPIARPAGLPDLGSSFQARSRQPTPLAKG